MAIKKDGVIIGFNTSWDFGQEGTKAVETPKALEDTSSRVIEDQLQ